jgi:hypothetical protein
MKPFLIAVSILASIALSSCATDAPLSAREKSDVLGAQASPSLRWRKTEGPDFMVYRAEAKSPLSGQVGFYVGTAPNFQPEQGSTVRRGRLGAYSVQWHRKIDADGSIHQSAVITLQKDSYYIHAWVYSDNELNLNALVLELSKLRRFATVGSPASAE